VSWLHHPCQATLLALRLNLGGGRVIVSIVIVSTLYLPSGLILEVEKSCLEASKPSGPPGQGRVNSIVMGLAVGLSGAGAISIGVRILGWR